MRLVAEHQIEDCFDGSQVVEYEIDEVWSKELIYRLEQLGTLEYFDSFPQPMFRVVSPERMVLKGVTGSNVCRVVFPQHNLEALKQSVRRVLNADSD